MIVTILIVCSCSGVTVPAVPPPLMLPKRTAKPAPKIRPRTPPTTTMITTSISQAPRRGPKPLRTIRVLLPRDEVGILSYVTHSKLTTAFVANNSHFARGARARDATHGRRELSRRRGAVTTDLKRVTRRTHDGL